MQKRWDIFCKIIDNFGDIGVCWRLARQLQSEHGLQIRLWVDDLRAAQKIIPSLNINSNQQVIDNVSIAKWQTEADFCQAADMVIEAFACDLPTPYLAAMVRQKSKWINLEYLSAETWVDDFHAKPSPKPENKLVRHFYFPGFTPKTGGLIREADIAEKLQKTAEASFPRKRESILDENSRWIPAFAGMTESEVFEGVLNISLFCYPFAPIGDLLTALQANTLGHPLSNSLHEFDSPCTHAVHVYVPQSSILPNIAQFFGKKSVQVGDKLIQNNLTVEILPFLSQADYDKLLRDCDLNFVRGEDSWVRAIWAGKPFIWQPYIQHENAHMKKLDAFLSCFYANYEQKQSACEAHRYWSAGMPCNDLVKVQLPKAILDYYLNDLTAIRTHTQLQSATLAKQPDLATKLLDFCNTI